MNNAQGYGAIAHIYDIFNGDVDYESLADFAEECFDRFLPERPDLVLDLACGTGILTAMLAERGQDVTAMIELDVPEDELMTRLLKRGQESGRADDNEETIKKRLVVYAQQTAPLKDWYKNEGKHCYINGLGELDRIFADIVAAIDSKI